MILKLTKPSLYICQFKGSDGSIKSFKFVPGDNKIPNEEAKFLLKHPGIKSRIDLGILVNKSRSTEDLVLQAQKEAAAATKSANKGQSAPAPKKDSGADKK
jgi:hypothetical protein